MSTKIAFWNVRGINEPDKHSPFSQWLRSQHLIFGALLETHIKEQNLNSLMQKLCPGWTFASNHASDDDGRIIIFWKHPTTITLIRQTRQTLTCEVSIPPVTKFVYTAVYAANTVEERNDLWMELVLLHQTYSLDSSPWAVGGDFNQILRPCEHSSASVTGLTPPMIDFADCLLQTGLFDLRYQGQINTWTNKCPTRSVAKKLDRMLVNQPGISLYPHSSAFFLPPAFSDHSPCILDLALPLPIAGTKPFKFFNYLTKHPNFNATVENFWIQAGSSASNLGELCWKLKQIK